LASLSKKRYWAANQAFVDFPTASDPIQDFSSPLTDQVLKSCKAEKKGMTKSRMRLQKAEACGPVNRWFCSEAHGHPVTDEETLLRYYIKSNGAVNFAKRYDEAMSSQNRWYCSEFYGQEISDPEILWDYYVSHAEAPRMGQNSSAELSLSC
jgi:hypothetical protein